MSSIKELHNTAMDLADNAIETKLKGDLTRAISIFHKALECEKKAALLTSFSDEPSRSILFRSAASLAMDCNEYREAERLIGIALSGDPPDEIAEELRDLYEQVNFSRHLKLKNVSLVPGEFQVSLDGIAVGLGLINGYEFMDRIDNLEKLIQRTTQRLLRKPFQERGRISDVLEIFLSTPRAASFAVSIKIGHKEQISMPFTFENQVVDELLDCMELFERDDKNTLKQKISDDAYLRNFIALAKKVAPDGERIRMVGFTTIKDGSERQVSLIRCQEETMIAESPVSLDHYESVSVTGRFLFADATSTEEKIKLIDSKGRKHNIIIPAGMMSDIVRPLWDETVVVTGIRIGKKIQLEDIKKANKEQPSNES